MMHSSLNIEDWKLIDPRSLNNISYKGEPIRFDAAEIDSSKFYFYLKKRFGLSLIDFNSLKRFFPKRFVEGSPIWCYVFKSSESFVLISGDIITHIVVLSVSDYPDNEDFEEFKLIINKKISNISLEDYKDFGYNIFINYSHLLKDLINNLYIKLKKESQNKPNPFFLQRTANGMIDQNDLFKAKEYFKKYNTWLTSVLKRASISLQIEILMPIYFESLVDLVFRINLKASLYKNKRIDYDGKKVDVFYYFERLNLHEKIKKIKEFCTYVYDSRLDDFLEDFDSGNYKKRIKRNKLLHGNSLVFKNTDFKFYLDSESEYKINYIIGLPDKHDLNRLISESIDKSTNSEELFKNIDYYKRMTDQFLKIFHNYDYLKGLISSIAFGHNTGKGGAIFIGLNNLNDLYEPEE